MCEVPQQDNTRDRTSPEIEPSKNALHLKGRRDAFNGKWVALLKFME
jgi:hypothetical protein